MASTGGPIACARSTVGVSGRRGRRRVRALRRAASTSSSSTISSAGEREERLAALCGFLGIEAGRAGMRGFFDGRDERGRHAPRPLGRRSAGPLGRARVRRSYERTLSRPSRRRQPRRDAADRDIREARMMSRARPLPLLERHRAWATSRARWPSRGVLTQALEPLFFTLSGAAPVVRGQGFPVEFAASYATPTAGSDWRWSRRLRGRLRAVLREADPRVLVFDGAHPYQALIDAMPCRAGRASRLVQAADVEAGLQLRRARAHPASSTRCWSRASSRAPRIAGPRSPRRAEAHAVDPDRLLRRRRAAPARARPNASSGSSRAP